MTNYEKIKAMSINEMAEMLVCNEMFDCDECPNKDNVCCHDICIKMHKQWLRSEVSNDR